MSVCFSPGLTLCLLLPCLSEYVRLFGAWRVSHRHLAHPHTCNSKSDYLQNRKPSSRRTRFARDLRHTGGTRLSVAQLCRSQCVFISGESLVLLQTSCPRVFTKTPSCHLHIHRFSLFTCRIPFTCSSPASPHHSPPRPFDRPLPSSSPMVPRLPLNPLH